MDGTLNTEQFMRPFGNKKQLFERQDYVNIAILATIAFVLGVYLIATTFLIAQDGTLYVNLAKNITGSPIEDARNMSQCPGYPYLIYLMHKIIGVFYGAMSLQGWIISAQSVSLLSKIIASAALYFVGSYFVGSRLSFWGVLILSVLPDSAEYGSDALTEWSFLMFLTIGFLLLLLSVEYRKSWMFGLVGLTAGLAYLVRSEGIQLVIYGCGWLLFNLIRPQGIKRTKVLWSLILLIAVTAIITIPYIRLKEYVFPDQSLWRIPYFLRMSHNTSNSIFSLAGLSTDKIAGNKTLTVNLCETLIYYYVPGLVIGCYYYFRKQSKTLTQTFFAATFIILNIVMLIWQLHWRLALSRRNSLALIAFTIFYIPAGLLIIAGWLNKITSKRDLVIEENTRRCFFILMAIGFCICAVKLARGTPLRWDKQGYKEAAEWLKKNTASEDIIAAQDMRIVFYAERKGLKYQDCNEAAIMQANYIVSIVKNKDEKPVFSKAVEVYSTRLNKHKKSRELVINKVID